MAASEGLAIASTILVEDGLYLKTSAISPDGNAVYFGTFSSPGKIVNVSLVTNSVVETVTPSSGPDGDGQPIYAGSFHKSLISLDGSTVYFVSSETPAKVVRYYTNTDPPLMNTLSHGATVYSVVQHPKEAYLYYGITNTDDGVNGILKVNIDVDNSGFLELRAQGKISAAVIDSEGEFAYFASDQTLEGEASVAGKITKVGLLDNSGSTLDMPEIVNSIELDNIYDMSGAAVIATGNQFAYFATSESEGTVSQIVQIQLGNDFDPSNIRYIDLPEIAGIVKSLLMAPDGSALYALTEFSLLKFNITEDGPSHDATLMLNASASPADAPETAVISPDGSKIYVGHSTGKVTVVTISPTTYTISYDANGPNINGVTPNAQIKTHAQNLTIVGNVGRPDMTPLLRSGHTFAGWDTTPDGTGDDYAAASTYTANTSTTLYAQWDPVTYTISYEPNGATSGTTPNAQTGVHDQVSITIADNPGTLVKTGYTFVGWNTSAEGGENTRQSTENVYITNASLTLYAEWTPS